MIKIIAVGSIKEKFIREALLEYTKRLTKYTKLEIIEVKDYDLGNPIINMEREKEEIKKHLTDKDYIVTLEIEGEELSSVDFSKKLDKILSNHANVVFIIGGSDGLDLEIKNRGHYKLSFSKMTFPHQLFRVLLLEQIYRAYKINHNESYHK